MCIHAKYKPSTKTHGCERLELWRILMKYKSLIRSPLSTATLLKLQSCHNLVVIIVSSEENKILKFSAVDIMLTQVITSVTCHDLVINLS